MKTVLANLAPYPRGRHYQFIGMPDQWGVEPGTPLIGGGWAGDKFGKIRTAVVKVAPMGASETREVSLEPIEDPIEADTARLMQTEPTFGDPWKIENIDRVTATTAKFPIELRDREQGSVALVPQHLIAPNSGIWFFTGRLGMLVVECWFQLLPGNPIIPIDINITNSDPRTPLNVASLDLSFVTGAQFRHVINHDQQKGIFTEYLEGFDEWHSLLMLSEIGDRQTIRLRGRIHLMDAAVDPEAAMTLEADRHLPAVGMCLEWEKYWGLWNATSPLGREATQDELTELVLADFYDYDNRMGVLVDRGTRAKQARKTGWDKDYSLSRDTGILNAGHAGPLALYMHGHEAELEGMRPQQVYDANGFPDALEAHPLLIAWGSRPHYDNRVSKDQMNKPNSKGLFGWQPMSDSHACVNGLAADTLLSLSYGGQRLMENNAFWLRARRNRSFGETRGKGRLPQVGGWCYLTTGDNRILDYFEERWEAEFKQFLDRLDTEVPPDVIPWSWTKARNDWPLWKANGHAVDSFIPWQEAIMLRGLDGMHQVYMREKGQNDKVRDVIRGLCDVVVGDGWYWHEATNRWVLGYQIARMEGDRALTPEEYQDQKKAAPHYGTQVDLWALASVYISRREGIHVDKCNSIIQQYEASHAEQELAFDEWSAWRAIN